MDWLKTFKQQNKLVIILAIGSTLAGIGLSASSLSGTKYDVIEFCFKPSQAKHPERFCTPNKRYIVPIGYWKQEDYNPANPQFQSDDTFLLSEKATRLRVIKATNPNSINLAIASLSLLALSTYIVSKRTQRYKREFSLYFEQLKTDLATQIEEQSQQRDIISHKIKVETQYIKDSIDRKDMITRTFDKGGQERDFESEQASKHNELVELQRQLHIANLEAQIAKQQAEAAKFNQECYRYSSRIKSDVEIAEEIDYEALCPGKVGEIEFYDWRYLADEAVGIIIAGNSGCGKTSVATWIAGWLTKDKPAQVLALDPHANRNPLWRELGIEFLQEFGQIEQAMQTLVGILDHRRGLPEGSAEFDDEIIVFADELGACIKQFEDPANIEIALERLGSEGRKYGICFIVLNQSANADDLGISADLRTIDSLWVKYSNGRFGFSVQKKIYLSVGGKPDGKYYDEDWKKFGDAIGWRKGWFGIKKIKQWISLRVVTYSTSAPVGHLPFLGFTGWFQKGWFLRTWTLIHLFSRIQTCKI